MPLLRPILNISPGIANGISLNAQIDIGHLVSTFSSMWKVTLTPVV